MARLPAVVDRHPNPRIKQNPTSRHNRTSRNGNYVPAGARRNADTDAVVRMGLDSDKHDDLPRNAAVVVAYCIPAGTAAAAACGAAAAAVHRKSEIEAISCSRSIQRSTCATCSPPSAPSSSSSSTPTSAWIQRQKRESGGSTSQTTSEHLRVGSVLEFCLRNSTVTRQDESRRGCRRHGRHSRQGKPRTCTLINTRGASFKDVLTDVHVRTAVSFSIIYCCHVCLNINLLQVIIKNK